MQVLSNVKRNISFEIKSGDRIALCGKMAAENQVV